MKENKRLKLNRDYICLIAYGAIFVICALAFWLFCPPDGAAVYSMVVLWLLMPLASVLFSYMLAVTEKPRGWKRLAPLMCGAALMLLEYLTFSLKNMIAFPGKINVPSVSLAIVGLVASLIGFAFARQDRRERAKGKKGKVVVSAPETKKAVVESQPKAEHLNSPSEAEVVNTQQETLEISKTPEDAENAVLEHEEQCEANTEKDSDLPEENKDFSLDEDKAEEDTEAINSIEGKVENGDTEPVSHMDEDDLGVEDTDVAEPTGETAHLDDTEGKEVFSDNSIDEKGFDESTEK